MVINFRPKNAENELQRYSTANILRFSWAV